MDKCVDAAFAGTEEFDEEPPEHFFDGIFGPEDEATADVEDDVDKEQEFARGNSVARQSSKITRPIGKMARAAASGQDCNQMFAS